MATRNIVFLLCFPSPRSLGPAFSGSSSFSTNSKTYACERTSQPAFETLTI